VKFPVSPLVEQVRLPPISEVRRWIGDAPPGLPVIDLCQAVPDYPPSSSLVDHLREIVSDPSVSRYSPDEGLPEVRESVAARLNRVYGGVVQPDEICLTIGASQAFWLAVTTLCRAGDEIILQLPCYFDHPMALGILGIRPVFAPFDEATGGIPSPDVIDRLVTPRTRGILIVTPSNPAGTVTPPEVLRELYLLAKRRGIALLLDETYNAFVPGGLPPHSLFADPSWGDHLIHIASLGKTYSLTGYRAGFLAASEGFLRHALKGQDTMAVCQPRITQHAVCFGCDNLDSWVEEKREMMERRHTLFVEEFSRPGNPFRLVASGSFFGWVRHPFIGLTGMEAARRLVTEAGVLVLPGEAFGPGLEGYLRLAIGNVPEDTIPEAVRRLREF
jgi:aspartate/methionine/tyrosine aminotransferase